MRVVTKVISDELEKIKFYINNSLTYTVEVFTVPEGYKSFAYNSYLHHTDLEGTGFHEGKDKSVELALQDLREMMDAFQGYYPETLRPCWKTSMVFF
ncbi:hypothetical protein [Bacillus sp. UNC41MFS5]|uniref:hypothetical protein n=1 Tax=Bacillus sp. UNC41MFS5 TaxID=1449046 RepID=UPI00047AF662|nr:hypothetical protein [Bacillus sp. UNC41MFS5]